MTIEKWVDMYKADLATNTKYNPLFPYLGWKREKKLSPWHTWSKYHKLVNILTSSTNKEIDFHKRAFLTEWNYVPAKSSPNPILSESRIEFIKNSAFFQSFKIVILSCWNYLTKEQIEDIFEVKFQKDFQIGKRKLKICTSEKKIVINSNQLSGPISNAYLEKIAEEANQHVPQRTIHTAVCNN